MEGERGEVAEFWRNFGSFRNLFEEWKLDFYEKFVTLRQQALSEPEMLEST